MRDVLVYRKVYVIYLFLLKLNDIASIWNQYNLSTCTIQYVHVKDILEIFAF